jgi:hypothetical protein
MCDEADLLRMSPGERARLARALAALDAPSPLADEEFQRRGRLLTGAALAGAVVLAAWIGVLAISLPPHYRAGGWRAAWVGFDVGLMLVFVATAWSAWRRRQVLILCLIVLATLLCCDAWFDAVLDWRTGGFAVSLLSALLVELPLAVVALSVARRLLRLTIGRLEALEGIPGPVPPFWQVPLFGDDVTTYRHLWRSYARKGATGTARPGPAGAAAEGIPAGRGSGPGAARARARPRKRPPPGGP